MRSKLIFFALMIFLCAAGAGSSHAGWVGTCGGGGATIDCSCPSKGLSDPYTYYAFAIPDCIGPPATSQADLDAACQTGCTKCMSISCDDAPPEPTVSVVMDSVDNLTGIPVAKGTATGEGITVRGFSWWLPPNPDTGDGGMNSGLVSADSGLEPVEGSFSMSLTGLRPSTAYHIKAYIFFNGSNIAYSDEYLFTTGTAVAPTVITKPDFTVNDDEVFAEGEITDIGSDIVFKYGFVYATHPNPTVGDQKLTFTEQTSEGKAFEGTITGLSLGKYYFRAYADNSEIIGYGEEYSFTATVSGNIDAADKYAWSENTGWLNFNSMGGINVFADHVEGYVWHENIGWIKLGAFTGEPHTYGNIPGKDYGVNNDGYGNLSGYGWSENTGWINFRTAGRGVTIDPDGNFSGYAWGENIGWIHFANTTPAYKVAAKWISGATLYPLTLLTDGKGKGTADGTGSFVTGQAVNITAAPDVHSLFAGWSPEPCSESFDMPESDLSCTATFDLKTYELAVNKTGAGNGTVSEGGSIAYGTRVTLTAAPDDNSVFAGWSPSQCGTGFTMPGSGVVCTATFDLKPYGLTVNTAGTGSGTVRGAGDYFPGETVKLTAGPGAKSLFRAWSPAPCAREFVMPESDLTCTATFERF